MADNLIYLVKDFINYVNNDLNKKTAEYDKFNKNSENKKTKEKLKAPNYKEVVKDSRIIHDLLNYTNKDIDKEKDHSEIASWIDSLPVVADILDNTGLKDSSAQIVLEAHYGSSERADVVLVGTRNNMPVILFIENKIWNLNNYKVADNCCLLYEYEDEKQKISEYKVHPCIQVERYRYIMEKTNSRVQKYMKYNNIDVKTAVFMQGPTQEDVKEKKGPFNEIYKDNFKNTPIFIEKGTLIKFIEDSIDAGPVDLFADNIYKSEWKPSEDYMNKIGTFFGNREELEKVLKLELDEKQLAIFTEIKTKVILNRKENKKSYNNNKSPKTVYVIEGIAGTGKSFLAVALLSYLYQEEHPLKVRCLLKNKDARKAYNKNYETAISNAITHGGQELFEDNCFYDCLICDEAHRMPEKVLNDPDHTNVERIIEKSDVSVFFYDKNQSVSYDDYITSSVVEQYTISKNYGYILRTLKYVHRASTSFLDFLNGVLYNNKTLAFKNTDDYLVRIVKKPELIKRIIKRINNENPPDIKKWLFPSRMLAGKGRTKEGKDWKWLSNWTRIVKNGNFIGWKRRNYRATVTIGPLRNSNSNKPIFKWDEKYKGNNTFWLDCKSVDHVGCIDCSQGLDFEYVGVIIAEDLVYNKNKGVVEVSKDRHRSDDIKIFPKSPKSTQNSLKLGSTPEKLIKNTYYVLLSRGRKGCFIYCENGDLEGYLLDRGIPYFKEYIGDTETKIFHKFDCSQVYDCTYLEKNKDMKNMSKQKGFDTVKDAINAQYTPCQDCLAYLYKSPARFSSSNSK